MLQPHLLAISTVIHSLCYTFDKTQLYKSHFRHQISQDFGSNRTGHISDMNCFHLTRSRALCSIAQPVRNVARRRTFQCTTLRVTDGVYKELTKMRVRTPWIEALRQKQKEGIDPTKGSDEPATPSDRDLSPKKMSDSHVRIVRT